MRDSPERRVSYRVRLKQKKRWLFLFFLFDLMFAGSIIVIPFLPSSEEPGAVLRYLTGAVFWLGLIGVIVVAVWINTNRKRSKGFRNNYNRKKLGLINFFQNRYAAAADILMFVSLFAVIIFELAVKKQDFSIYAIGVFAFAFSLHCLLNGICYEYINYKVRSVNNHESTEKTVG